MSTTALLLGIVVAIADGDTLTILDESNRQTKIRLAEIDAPERGQPYGTRSKQSLSEVCFRQPAAVYVVDIDRYGRTVGRVHCSGTDANAEQLRRGMAWVYDRYAKDKSLYRLQDEARATGRGLWADPEPTPPWEWRRRPKS